MSTLGTDNTMSSNDLEVIRKRLAEVEGEVLRLKSRPTAAIDAESVLESVTDGFLVYDSEFRFTYVNGDGGKLLGRPKAELLGRTHWEVFPESVGSETERQYQRTMKERVAGIFEAFQEFPEMWLEIRTSPSDAGGLLVWLRDITARRQTEIQREERFREIQAERQVLSEIIENSPVAISILGVPDFKYELANPAFEALAPGRQIVGCEFSEIWGEGSPPRVAELESLVATALPLKTVDSPLTIQRGPDAPAERVFLTSYWIPLIGPGGSPDRILLLATETTERKRQEDRLRASEARLVRAQRMANLGSWEQDLETGEIQMGKAACRIFGIAQEDALTTLDELLLLVHPDDSAAVRETIQNARVHGGRGHVDHRILCPDGAERYVRQFTELQSDAGGPGILVGTVQDVTEYKLLEEKLLRAQRLEGIAHLAGGVAHDFNNLLVLINGYAHMIVSELKTEDELRDSAQEIIKAGNRAATLTRQLLAVSRRQVTRPRVIHLDSLLTDLEKMLRRLIPEDIEMKRELATEAWCVRADADKIEQVVMNLVVNARDAMPKGGTLTIATSCVEIGDYEVKSFSGLKPGRYVSLTVTDTGTGMTAETKRRLFEPFFTTKPPGEGTGLGLSIVYGIVKQHGGDVSFYSELGLGTTFRIYWPVADQPCDPAPAPRKSRLPYRGSETILLAEDDDHVRKLVGRMLWRQGYKVLEAGQSSEALNMATQHKGPIDLLLTDVVMPKVSGQDLAAQVKAVRPGIKVVFMSGYPGVITEAHGVLAEGAFFLNKPFEADDLWQILREALGTAPAEPHPEAQT